jgi:flagellar protein FlaG
MHPESRSWGVPFRAKVVRLSVGDSLMSNFNDQPEIRIQNSEDYREGYSNSVQVRMSVWDFFLAFGKALPGNGPGIDLLNFQGIYLSPQQAKALSLMLHQNITNYEQTFGEIKLDPQFTQNGPIH